jgi:hypothetical protein
MFRRLDVFVLSDARYYRETPLLEALRCNRAVRMIYKERYSTDPINRVNALFIDPAVYSTQKDYGFDDVRALIESTRREFPNVVIVLCSILETINSVCRETGGRFDRYFRLDYKEIKTAPDPLVEDMIGKCQVEIDHNIRSTYQFDVAISFAGEQRQYAEEIAEILRRHGVSVFCDGFENLFGYDLYAHLHDVYNIKAQYCILLASEAYTVKAWTNHERQAAQERALREKGAPYILPVRFGNTKIPGLSANIAYLSIEMGVDAICERVLNTIGAVGGSHD